VPKERVTQAGTAARALDETRHVRDGRPPLVVLTELHDAEVGLEGGERVVGDLRGGGGDGRKQGRLAGVRQPDEPDVGDEAELEPEPCLRTGLALLCVAGRLVRGSLEMRVAETAAPAARDHRLLSYGHEVGQELAGLVAIDRGPGRNVEDQVVARLAVTAGTRAAATGRRPEMVSVAEIAERRLARVDTKVDRASASAVTAVRAAAWDVCLLPEGRGPVAAVAGADPDLHAVEEHRPNCGTSPGLDRERHRSARSGERPPAASGATPESVVMNRESWRRTVPAKAPVSTRASAPQGA
jgi:hypothetical protein